MPLYEYRCLKCFHTIEVLQRFGDPGPEKCVHCDGAMRKLFSSPAIQFKGSGFYVNDYGRPGGSSGESSSASSSESSSSEGSGKSVTTSETGGTKSETTTAPATAPATASKE